MKCTASKATEIWEANHDRLRQQPFSCENECTLSLHMREVVVLNFPSKTLSMTLWNVRRTWNLACAGRRKPKGPSVRIRVIAAATWYWPYWDIVSWKAQEYLQQSIVDYNVPTEGSCTAVTAAGEIEAPEVIFDVDWSVIVRLTVRSFLGWTFIRAAPRRNGSISVKWKHFCQRISQIS